jgi:ferritin-like metal-binding protein YciE
MPLEKHLVVHLQEMHMTERDFRDYLQEKVNQIQNQQLRSMVNKQIDGIGMEMNNLEQCLDMMGAQPKADGKSPIVQAFRQEDEMTMKEMPNMTSEDMDAHLAITDAGFGEMEEGIYQSMILMAQTLGKDGVASKLKQTMDHEVQDLEKMQNFLPTLIEQSQQPRA